MAKDTSSSTQMFVILAVVALLVAAAYWWFFQPGGAGSLPPAPTPMEERAAPVEGETDLDAARTELDSTNLGQVDVELQDLNTKTSY